MRIVSGLILAAIIGLAGCASFTPSEIAKPSDITLDAALQDVVHSLHRAQEQYPSDRRLGLMVDQVDVNFEVAAKASAGGSRQLNIAQVPIGGPGGTLGFTAQGQESSDANRGNTIKITFRNIATADMTKGYYKLVAPTVTAKPRSAGSGQSAGGPSLGDIIFKCPPGNLCTMGNAKVGVQSRSIAFECPPGKTCTMDNTQQKAD
ncbi:hypothetical protein GOC60_05170 [Sinorhizobium meliloti]|nr:hypothetical protein [Sinorhizobium meliloti]MDX0260596.1 hypothetical protein [Sinorhizobium meliloti]MDX0347709.1 hypothetical protein [Sinorhizobium meliloti]